MKRGGAASEGLFGIWGLLAGALGALCCVGPSAAVLLGLGAGSAVAGLAVDRHVALLAGAGALAVGLVLAARQARACSAAPAARWRAPAMLLASFALSYALLGLLLPRAAAGAIPDSPGLPSAAARVEAAAPRPGPRRATLTVDKLYCPPCAATVRAALKREPAVGAWEAHEESGLLVIDYDPARLTAGEIAGLFPEGFGVALVRDEPLPGAGEP